MLDFEKIKQTYQLDIEISFNDVLPLVQTAELRVFKPYQYLIKAGEEKKDIFFVLSGIVREFKVKENKEEVTNFLHWENHVFASYDTFFFQQPAQYFCQALEPTTVLTLSQDVLETLVLQNPKLEKSRKDVFQVLLQRLIKRVYSFTLYSPEERYLEFIAANPNIAQRVPDKYIASMLGITPVSLSRIRKRLSNKGKLGP